MHKKNVNTKNKNMGFTVVPIYLRRYTVINK